MNTVAHCQNYALIGLFSIVRRILSLIQIIAPILLIISLMITFSKIVMNPEEKKNQKKIINSILATVILFFIPTFVNAVFGLLGNSTSISSCWQNAGGVTQAAVYVPLEKEEKKSIVVPPEDYQKGKQVKQLTELIYYAQGNYSNVSFCNGSRTLANSGCGAVSYAMIASSYSSSSFTPPNVANWFCTNHFSTSNGALRNEAATSQDALAHFGLKAEVLFDKSGQSSMNYGTSYNSQEGSKMLEAVQQGKAVMFGMPKHWSVVGPNALCPSNKFYLYNPGRPSSNGCYTPEELFQYTYNYNNHCNKSGWCGWDIAIAFYNAS